jgi:hypothetical protein
MPGFGLRRRSTDQKYKRKAPPAKVARAFEDHCLPLPVLLVVLQKTKSEIVAIQTFSLAIGRERIIQ